MSKTREGVYDKFTNLCNYTIALSHSPKQWLKAIIYYIMRLASFKYNG